jgi:MFS family permease
MIGTTMRPPARRVREDGNVELQDRLDASGVMDQAVVERRYAGELPEEPGSAGEAWHMRVPASTPEAEGRPDSQAYETTRRNARILNTEVAWSGAAGGVYTGFLSIFALHLGASPAEIGLLTTGPALAGIIFPLPAAWLVKRCWGKPVVVTPLAVYRMLYAVVALVALLPAQSRVAVLVGAVGLLSVPLAFFNTAFVPLFAKVLPQDLRGRVIGIRGTVAGLTGTAGVLVAGWILDRIPFPLNFEIMFGVAFFFAQASTWLISRLEIPALNEDLPATPPPGAAQPSGTGRVRRLPRHAPFWRFIGSVVVLLVGIYLPIALYPLVLVDRLHASNAWIGALSMAGGLCGVVLALLWAPASAKIGSRWLLVAICALYTLVPLGASHAASLGAYIPVSLAGGGLGAVLGMGILQCLLEVTPERQQTQYLAIYSMVANTAVASAPLLGTFVLSTAGMAWAFALAACCIALGSSLLALSGRTSAAVAALTARNREPEGL